jgi:hypothetical protein
VPLSAGEHTITVDNLGDDWLELEYIEVGQLVAPARVLTLRDAQAGIALAWLQHRDYTWEKVAEDVAREPILFEYRLGGMPAGRYVAEIWDPLSGAVLGEELLRVGEDGLLRFTLVPMNSQLALRAVRQPDAPTPAPTETVTETPFASETLPPTLTPTLAAVATETASSSPTEIAATPSRTARPAAPAKSTRLATLVPFMANTNTPRPSTSSTPNS